MSNNKEYKATPNLVQLVKSAIDTIYELTKDGYAGSISSFKDRYMNRVTTELIKRKVITKTREGCQYTYMWVASSAPTAVFYQSVADTIAEMQNKKEKKGKNSSARVVVMNNSIKDATSQELWDELKRRGYVIEDGKLVVIQKRYLA